MIAPFPTRFTAQAPDAPRADRGRLRILVVEDEPWLSVLLRDSFFWEPHIVDGARDRSAARAMAIANAHDVIVLGLPGHDGTELCRQMRSGGSTTPILILDARATVDDVVAGLDAGADDYLAALVDLNELLARIHAISRRTSVAGLNDGRSASPAYA